MSTAGNDNLEMQMLRMQKLQALREETAALFGNDSPQYACKPLTTRQRLTCNDVCLMGSIYAACVVQVSRGRPEVHTTARGVACAVKKGAAVPGPNSAAVGMGGPRQPGICSGCLLRSREAAQR